MKGAPEEIIYRCSNAFDSNGNESPIEQEEILKQIEDQVIMYDNGSGPMGLKAISFAQKTMDASYFESGMDFENI